MTLNHKIENLIQSLELLRILKESGDLDPTVVQELEDQLDTFLNNIEERLRR